MSGKKKTTIIWWNPTYTGSAKLLWFMSGLSSTQLIIQGWEAFVPGVCVIFPRFGRKKGQIIHG
jgi:hypothetical protein